VKRIGEIAARLVANPVELVAAANQKRSTELVGAPPQGGESEAPMPGLEAPSKAKGKGPSPKARPVNREVVKQQRGETALQTLPRIGRCERMANSPPMNATSPVAAMRSHLLTEWLRHATGPR
jgi:hypothetical protein